MKTKNILLSLSISGLLFSSGCGSDDEKKADPVITYATLDIENSAETTENGKLELTGLTTCTHSSETDLFTAAFSGQHSQALEIKIKGFRLENSTHTCAQNSKNTAGDISDGKYDVCSVKFSVLKATDSDKLNTYNMYRDSTDDDDFTYEGECTLSMTYAEPKVSGTITCTKMIQTHYSGTRRAKIDTEDTADLASTSEFFCNLP